MAAGVLILLADVTLNPRAGRAHAVGSLRFLAPLGPFAGAAFPADLGFLALAAAAFFFFLPLRAARSASTIACARDLRHGQHVMVAFVREDVDDRQGYMERHATVPVSDEHFSAGRVSGFLHVTASVLPHALKSSQTQENQKEQEPLQMRRHACRLARRVRMSASAVFRTASNTSGRSPARSMSMSGCAW